jgi:hypothetical protein
LQKIALMALAPIIFDPANWYWIVAQDTTRVYSSAAAGYVPTRDPTYMAWQASGNLPSRIVSEQELWDYLNGRVMNATPSTGTSTDAAKDQRIAAQLSEVIYQIAFFHENRLRTLEAQPPVTQDQFLSRVKGLMK